MTFLTKMAFIHQNSCECIKSELDLFTVPATQTSIESGNWVEYNPISSLADGVPIEFSVSGSGQDYIDLANTQLYVKAEIVQANGTAIDDTHQVGPVNLLLHSLFSEVDFKLNDTLISSTNNTYPYRAYIETLLSYGPTAKQSQLTAALYYKDEAEKMDDANPLAAAANMGLKKRHSFFSGGGVVDMVGCLHADLFFQDKYLPSDVGLRLRLVRSKNSFALMSTVVGAAFKIKLHDVKLLIRKVKISPSVYVAHAKALEVGNAKYPVKRVVCKTFTVPRGNLDCSQENLFTGQLPTRLVVGLVDNDAYNGAYDKSPFNFKNYNLTQLKVYLDGQQGHLIRPLEPNYAARQYITSYMSLFTGTGKNQKDEGNDISRVDYANGYALYCFDLTPDLGAGDNYFNLAREGSVRIDMKFATALAGTINAVVYAEFENVLEIDRNRNIIFDSS